LNFKAKLRTGFIESRTKFGIETGAFRRAVRGLARRRAVRGRGRAPSQRRGGSGYALDSLSGDARVLTSNPGCAEAQPCFGKTPPAAGNAAPLSRFAAADRSTAATAAAAAGATLGSLPPDGLAWAGSVALLAARASHLCPDAVHLAREQVDGPSERERERVGSRGRWKRPCLQTAHMTRCY
jgi:hypothetical protein